MPISEPLNGPTTVSNETSDAAQELLSTVRLQMLQVHELSLQLTNLDDVADAVTNSGRALAMQEHLHRFSAQARHIMFLRESSIQNLDQNTTFLDHIIARITDERLAKVQSAQMTKRLWRLTVAVVVLACAVIVLSLR